MHLPFYAEHKAQREAASWAIGCKPPLGNFFFVACLALMIPLLPNLVNFLKMSPWADRPKLVNYDPRVSLINYSQRLDSSVAFLKLVI